MVPESGSINPDIMDNRVDFPQPDGPTMEVKLPGSTSKFISLRAVVSRSFE